MLGKSTRVVTPYRKVLHHLVTNPGGVGKLFGPLKTPHVEGMHHVSVKKARLEFPALLNSLPSKKDRVHRGMSGFKEVANIALDGRFGAGVYAKRPFILDIAQFIHNPKSSALLSTSPDPHTVKEYMVGFQIVRADGAIASTCLPPVSILPQVARHIDVAAFQYYQNLLNGQQEPGEFRRVEDIFDLAQGNNETTVILGAKQEDDWRPRVDTDLQSIVIVQGAAGRFLKGFIKAETLDTILPWRLKVDYSHAAYLVSFFLKKFIIL
ncbi:hypothetical protein Lstg_3409, partial [Legionella steigerwaltii]